MCHSTAVVIPFSVQFRPGLPLYEQAAYAATKAIVSGHLMPGDAFPSVRTLSKELKINPNTAHKVIASLINAGLLEIRPGVGTVVAPLPEASAKERTRLLENEILASMGDHWKRLTKRGPRGAAV